MPLYIDAREEEKQKWEYRIRHEGIDAKIGKNLPVDFLWECPTGLVFCERKTWPDFVDSFKSGGGADAGTRLIGQLLESPKSAAVRILLMEGQQPKYVMAGRDIVTAEAMDDALMSMQWQFGVVLAHSLNNDHTPTRLAALYRYTQKEDHTSLLRPVPPTPTEDIYFDPMFRKKIAAFMTVPQIGEKKALILPDNFESPRAAVNASQEELLKLPGWGKGRAYNFVEFWNKW